MTDSKIPKRYGTWPSPISVEDAGQALALSEPLWAENGTRLWLERQSDRTSLMTLDIDDNALEVDSERSLGGGILYGGGTYTVCGNQVIAVEAKSGRLIGYSLRDGSSRLICDLPGRAASPQISNNQKMVLFVHSYDDQDSIQLTSSDGSWDPVKLVTGADFYNYPRWHPEGEQIAWVSWNHPSLPWDSSTLYIGQLVDSSDDILLHTQREIAGGTGISVVQPEFSPDGRYLAYVSDQSGWWQLYLHDLIRGKTLQVTTEPADHGLPAWLQNILTYVFTPDSKKILMIRNQRGFASLLEIDLETGQEVLIDLDQPYTWLEGIASSPEGNHCLTIASSSIHPPRLISINTAGSTRINRRSFSETKFIQGFSEPKPVTWRSFDDSQVHGLFYHPRNPDFIDQGPPPLLVIVHSGPTSQVWADFHFRTQFFTSRGYAVLEVNYRGSTGYGRKYWEALKGQWGVIDVADVVSGAKYVAERGWADPTSMAVYGSSAGGYTVLKILVDHPGTFSAGISLYGISNQITLLKDPPKFERWYSDWLLGSYPEQEELYRARSPLFHADRIQDPVAIFQGGKDPVVPPDQAEQIVAALINNQVPHEYHFYPEESHGFKLAETTQDVYRKIEQFLEKYLLEASR